MKPFVLFVIVFLSSSATAANGKKAYCLAYLRQILNEEFRHQDGMSDSFLFNREAFDRAQLAFAEPERTSETWESIFANLRQSGWGHEVEFAYRRFGQNHNEYIRGTVANTGKDWNTSRRWVLIEVGSDLNSRTKIYYENISPESLTIRRPPLIPDWVMNVPKLSKLAEKVGIPSLYHLVSYTGDLAYGEETVFKILKTGKFDSPNRIGGIPGNNPRDSQFLMLTPGTSQKLVERPEVIIEFDLRILDRKDYYINRGWVYGVYSKSSLRFDEHYRIRPFLYYQGIGKVSGQHEVVVWAPIPTTYIKKIYVAHGMKTRMIERLGREGVSPPRGRNWDELIFERPEK